MLPPPKTTLNEPQPLSPEAAALRAEIERTVPLVESTMSFLSCTLPWFKVADPDQLLTAAVECTDQPSIEVDPFWSVLWRAAKGLEAFLSNKNVAGVRILDLGSGAGQAGVAAALLGGKVIFSDAVLMALKVAELNAFPVRERCEFRQLRWGQDQLDGERFPIIIGSDIVYDPNHFPQLERCARSHLAAGGRLLLSEPHRHTGDRFATWIQEAGWKRTEHDFLVDVDRVPIRVFECWLD